MNGLVARALLFVGIVCGAAAVAVSLPTTSPAAPSHAAQQTGLPTCSSVLNAGPPQQVTTTVQDAGSGVVSIVVTQSVNADTVVPPFIPGTTAPIMMTMTKIDQTQPATVRFRVTDGEGNVQYCYITFSPLVQSSEPTAPTCSYGHTIGPPGQVFTTIRDLESGVAGIFVTKSENADTVVPPFTPGTTDPIVVTSTKIDQTQVSNIEIRVTDVAGNVRTCAFSFSPLVTAVRIRSVTAAATRAGVIVRWRTASEVDALGFHVYRETNGRRVRVSKRLIAAKGGGAYSFLDRRAPRRAALRYWIQEVAADGSRSWYGPARVVRRA